MEKKQSKMYLKSPPNIPGCDSPYKNMPVRKTRCLSITHLNNLQINKLSPTTNKNKDRGIMRQSMLDGYQKGHLKKAVRFHEIVKIMFFSSPQNRIINELKRQVLFNESEVERLKRKLEELEKEHWLLRKSDNSKTIKIMELEERLERFNSPSPTSFNSNVRCSTRISDASGGGGGDGEGHMSVDVDVTQDDDVTNISPRSPNGTDGKGKKRKMN